MKKMSVLCFLLLLACFLHVPPAESITSLSVSPNSASADAPVDLMIQADAASVGNTLRVEVFSDPNGNGVVDSGESAVERYAVTDGVSSPSMGGVVNWNVPGDEDGTANGSIRTRLRLFGPPFPPAAFTVRVTDQDLSTKQTAFQFTKTPTAYSLSGRVTVGTTPVPGAFVAVVALPSECRVASAMTDTNGDYTAYVDGPGEYLVGVQAQGYLSKWTEQSPSSVSGATVSETMKNPTGVDLQVFSGTHVIEGFIRDNATEEGIAGAEVEGALATLDAEYEAYVLTGWDGSFSLPVVDGEWELEASGLYKKGYVDFSDPLVLTVSGGNLTHIVGLFPRGNALIHGTLRDGSGQALSGEEVVEGWAWLGDTGYEARSDTDTNGHYVLGVLAGRWQVSADVEDFCRSDLAKPSWQSVVAVQGQAYSLDLVAPLGGMVEGIVRLSDPQGTPVPWLSIQFFGDRCWQQWVGSAETEEDGTYRATLPVGTYYAHACPERLLKGK